MSPTTARQESKAVWQQVLDNALKWDYIRSASVKGEFWTAELQGGRAGGGIAPGRVPDPETSAAGCWARWPEAPAESVSGITAANLFWDEAYGFGLMELDGQETLAWRKPAASQRLSTTGGRSFASGESPRASVAIVIDEDLWNFVNSSGDEIKNNFVANLRGIHQALWQEGIPVDFLDAGESSAAGANYKVLIHPFPVALSGEAVDALRNFVGPAERWFPGHAQADTIVMASVSRAKCRRAVASFWGRPQADHSALGRNAHPTQSTYQAGKCREVALEGVDASPRLRCRLRSTCNT